MMCGNKADLECVRVILGMGEARCDFAGNLHRHYICCFCDLVVARDGWVMDTL